METVSQFDVTDELFERYESITQRVAAEVQTLISEARVEHIGATAVPGLITKADLDVAVHVEATVFEAAVHTLDTRFSRVHEEYWVQNALATYSVPPIDGVEISLQLVAIGGERDFFVRVRDILRRRPDFCTSVNQIKRREAPNGMEAYRAAKSEFYEPLLAWRASTQLEWYDFEEYFRPPDGTEVLAQVRYPDGVIRRVLGRYEENGDFVCDEGGLKWGWDTPAQVVMWTPLMPLGWTDEAQGLNNVGASIGGSIS